MSAEELDEVATMKTDQKMEETFQYYISGLYKMLEKVKRDIDIISLKVAADHDRLIAGEMIDAWEKACQATKKMDDEIYMLGSIMQDEDDFPMEKEK